MRFSQLWTFMPILSTLLGHFEISIVQPKKCLNVRQKLGTRTLSLTLSLSHSHSFTLLFTHSWHAEQLLFSCLCSKVTISLSHSLTLTLSHSHTLSFSHSLSLDMLNNFCFHLYAQKSLFIGEIAMLFSWPHRHPIHWHLSSWSWFPAKNTSLSFLSWRSSFCQI